VDLPKGLTYKNLVEKSVRNAVSHDMRESPRWVAVMDTFGLGSTYAVMVCKHFNLDPDETIDGITCMSCFHD